MKCHQCSCDVTSEDAFCGECGAKVIADTKNVTLSEPPTCPECGQHITAGEAFCGECGCKLSSSQGLPFKSKTHTLSLVYPLPSHFFIVCVLGISYSIYRSIDEYIIGAFIVISFIVGISNGLFIKWRKIKLSERKYHSFSQFFLVAFIGFYIWDFILEILFGITDPSSDFLNLMRIKMISSAGIALLSVGLAALFNAEKD